MKKANNLEHSSVQEISVTDVNQDGINKLKKAQKRTSPVKKSDLEVLYIQLCVT